MSTTAHQRIDELVKQNKIMVFMKGNKLMPQCGFSNTVVQILNTLGVPYETVDVLADQEIRQGVKEYSQLADNSPSLYQRGVYWWLGYYDRDVSKGRIARSCRSCFGFLNKTKGKTNKSPSFECELSVSNCELQT